MRFMVLVPGNAESEAGVMPSTEILEAMTSYNQELVKAGVMLAGEGLHATSKGARIRFSGGQATVVDGPFTESKELIAGYWLIQVKSRDEAIEWAKRAPAPFGEGKDGEIELRQLFELEDFADVASSEAIEQARRLEQKLPKKKA